MSDALRDFLNAAMSPGSLIRMPPPEWSRLQDMMVRGQLSAFQGQQGYRSIAQDIMNEELRRRGVDPKALQQQQRGSMPLDMARKMLAARAETYRALGIPEEAGDDAANLRRRQRADEQQEQLKLASHYGQQAAAHQRHAKVLEQQLSMGMGSMRTLPPLPVDPFELEDLWINEATEETFNEWYQRRK